MHIVSCYIDDSGYIKPLIYKISHNIIGDEQINVFANNVVNPFKSSILLLRELSDFTPITTTSQKLETTQYTIDLKTNGFNYIQLPQPAFGGALECITTNTTLLAQLEIQKVLSYYDNIRLQFIPLDDLSDSVIVPFMEVRSNGIYIRVYQFNFKFASDWSSSCTSCTSGMMHVKAQLKTMSEQLYVAENSGYEISGKVVSDLNISDLSVLKEQINILLSNSIGVSKISDFDIVDLSDTILNM